MVHVYSYHHFSSQEVFTSQYEPLATCCSKTFVFVATSRQTVEVHDMTKKGCPLFCTFSTVGVVVNMVYSEKGDFIAALESKGSKQRSVTSTRVYINWVMCAPGQPGRVRVAGHSLRSMKLSSKVNQFEVIEIPTFTSPTCVKCCGLTGSIAIGLDRSVCLFHFREQRSDKVCYDFEHLLNIDIGFEVIDISICCNYLACISEKEFRIFKLHFQSEIYNARNSCDDENISEEEDWNQPIASSIIRDADDSNCVEDEYFVSWSFGDSKKDFIHEPLGQGRDFETLHSAVKLETLSANKTCLMSSIQQEEVYIDQSHGSVEVLGPVEHVIGQPIKIDLPGNISLSDEQQVSLSTLVYRRFILKRDAEVSLHSLQFIPTISSGELLKSDYGLLGSCIQPAGVTCFVSSHTIGYIYEVHPTVQLISTYPYSADTSQSVVVSGNMVHAMSKNGLETYTSRIFAAAVGNNDEVDNKQNACPSVFQEPCLIGLRPFIGIFSMVISADYLVMLSKDPSGVQPSSEASWGIYILKNALMLDLYNDILDLARRYQTRNSLAYLFLIQEAHLLLRSAMFNCHGNLRADINEFYQETCELLGKYYSRPDCDSLDLAIPYYTMSGKHLAAIITEHCNDHKAIPKGQRLQGQSEPYGEGLVHYLDYNLFDQCADVVLETSTAESVLAVYASTHPEKLASVILESNLVGYSLESALKLLEELKRTQRKDGSYYVQTALDAICQAIILLRLCEPDQARFLLTGLPVDDIIAVHVQKPWLLTDGDIFSPLAQLMRQHDPAIMILILVALHDNNSLSLERAVQLLKVQSSDLYPSNSHLRDYLEAILSSSHREVSFEKAANLLSEIYVQKLKSWKQVQSSPVKARGHRGHRHLNVGGYFGVRYDSLDDVLPLIGTKALRGPCSLARFLDVSKMPGRSRSPSMMITPKQGAAKWQNPEDTTCHCCCCYEDLIKAQSLLCTTSSNLGPHKLILEVTQSSEFMGSESLKLLCLAKLEPGLAAESMLKDYPHLVVSFVKNIFSCDELLWTKFLEHLFERLRAFKSGVGVEEERNKFIAILKDILDLAVSVLEPSAFINTLPSDGSLNFFLPYIEHSCCRLEANRLKDRISTDLLSKTEIIDVLDEIK